MISSKVDLTEHNDFGDPLFDEITDNDGNWHEYEGVRENVFLSIFGDRFNRFFRIVKIFKGVTHHDERERIFQKDWRYGNDCVPQSYGMYCERCGKSLIPWNDHELCKECLEDISRPGFSKCPWKSVVPIEGHNPKELFSLR